MQTRSRPPSLENDAAADCRVALLEPQCLARSGNDYATYLSATEQERLRALRRPQRRLEWLAARLAAKYLFLQRLEVRFPNAGQQWVPTLLQLSAGLLDAFPASMYQSVELSPSADWQYGGLCLRWCGTISEAAISLSHAGNNACACLCTGDAVGVDLEVVAPRAAPFYRSNYTANEQDWVKRGASRQPPSRDWLYTLLWTVKEAALKAGAISQSNVWSFAGVEIGGLPAPDDMLWAHRKGEWSGRLGFFAAVIEEGSVGSRVPVGPAVGNRWSYLVENGLISAIEHTNRTRYMALYGSRSTVYLSVDGNDEKTLRF